LEVLAIAHAIVKAPNQCNVIIKSDSNVALFSFMKRTSSNGEIRKIISETYKLAQEKEITFIVRRVPTKENKADNASRLVLGN
jgi:hypothetical protein